MGALLRWRTWSMSTDIDQNRRLAPRPSWPHQMPRICGTAHQDMMRTMVAGGPKARFEPIAGDPDGAARVRGGANDGLADISYKGAGHVVFLRARGQGA